MSTDKFMSNEQNHDGRWNAVVFLIRLGIMRTLQFIFIRRLRFCPFLIFFAINKSISYIIYDNNIPYTFLDKLTIAECNVTGSKVEQSPMASPQHFLVYPIDDKQCELNFVLISIDGALTDILLELIINREISVITLYCRNVIGDKIMIFTNEYTGFDRTSF